MNDFCSSQFSEYALYYILTLIFIFFSSGKVRHDIILGATLVVTTICIAIIISNDASNKTVDFVLLIILASYTFLVCYSMFFRQRKNDNNKNLGKGVKISWLK